MLVLVLDFLDESNDSWRFIIDNITRPCMGEWSRAPVCVENACTDAMLELHRLNKQKVVRYI